MSKLFEVPYEGIRATLNADRIVHASEINDDRTLVFDGATRMVIDMPYAQFVGVWRCALEGTAVRNTDESELEQYTAYCKAVKGWKVEPDTFEGWLRTRRNGA